MSSNANNALALIAVIVLGVSLYACKTYYSDATGAPEKNGQYVTKKLGPIVIGISPQKTGRDKIKRFLLIGAAIGFVGLVAGVASWYLDRAGKIPCPWWDEVIVISAIVVGMCLVAYAIIDVMWYVIIGGSASYVVYRIVRLAYSWRARARARVYADGGESPPGGEISPKSHSIDPPPRRPDADPAEDHGAE